jgi:cytidylate kinase
MRHGFAIAIDGPVAAGKGTIASRLAKDLHGFYLYTGAMYRCLALECINRKIDVNDEEGVEKVLPFVEIQFKNTQTLLNGIDVTERIQEADAANGASIVSVYPHVRQSSVVKQQAIAKKATEEGEIVVAEGRDTGTRVLPEARLKIYLTAAPEIRAKRRLTQFLEQGRQVNYEDVLAEVMERDERDKARETDPLPSNPGELGYFILDDSKMSEEETLGIIKAELKKRKLI